MAASNDRAKVIALVEKLRETIEKRRDEEDQILAELSAVLGGAEGIGVKLQRLRKGFSECWQSRYNAGPYQWNFATDNAHLKRFLKTHSEADILLRMLAYVRSDDPFYVKTRHPFGIFVKGFNSFVGSPAQVAAEDTGAAQTRDRLQGLRGE